MFVKVQGLRENEDIQLRQQFKRIYTIVSFLSPTNVTLCDGNSKQLPWSVYINNTIKYKDRNIYIYGTSVDLPDHLEDSDEAQSGDENVSLSDQSENKNTAHQPYSECGVDHSKQKTQMLGEEG